MVSLHVLGLHGDPVVPPVGELAVNLLLGHQIVALHLSQVDERWQDVDRIASYDDHFVGCEGSFHVRPLVRVVRLCDPDSVIITGDVLPKHAQRHGLVERHLQAHVGARPDARDLLEIHAQECVPTSWIRLEGDTFTENHQVAALIEERALVVLSQSLLYLLVTLQIFAEKHFFEICEFDLLDGRASHKS